MSPSVGLLLFVLLRFSQALHVPDPMSDDDGEEDSVDIGTRILTTNNASDVDLFDGDLLYPTNRNLMMCWSGNSCRWPKQSGGVVVIPYTINNVFSRYEKDTIVRAMQEFHSKTCIRFTPRVRESDYLSLENGRGCYSALGKSGGRQVVSVSKNGCLDKGIIQHELCHALGFQHEQTRSDRDQYIKIYWDNIEPNMVHNFKKHQTINQGTPYDYNSIMHYGKYAFAKRPGQPTLTPYPNPSISVGQRKGMSNWDITRINKAYSCQ